MDQIELNLGKNGQFGFKTDSVCVTNGQLCIKNRQFMSEN
jgi:hypothetical protein